MSKLTEALGRPEKFKTVKGTVYLNVTVNRVQVTEIEFPKSHAYKAACTLRLYQFGFDKFIEGVNLLDYAHMQTDPLKSTRLWDFLNYKLENITAVQLDHYKNRSARAVVEDLSSLADSPNTRIPLNKKEVREATTRSRGVI